MTDEEPKPSSPVPGAVRAPRKTIEGRMIWIYGDPKIGKTTFAAQFPGAWFIATEPGQEFVAIREPTHIGSWNDFLALCKYITENKPTVFGDGKPIRTIVIDTVDILFKHCQAQVCKDLGVEDPGELPHGKGWNRLASEWERVWHKIRQWPYTLIWISHSRQKEFATKGQKVNRWEPYIGAAGLRFGNQAADIILFAHSDQKAVRDEDGVVTGIIEERLLRCHPQSSAIAGGRMVGELGIPPIIPLDFDEFIKYFPDTEDTE